MGGWGGGAALARYNRDRAADIPARTIGVDLLNRSLTSAVLPIDLSRGAALHAVAAFPALTAAFMRAGMASGPP